MSPPIRKEIHRGARWAKSLAGLTTLAAIFVARVAMHNASIATTRSTGLVKRVNTSTGSQIVTPENQGLGKVGNHAPGTPMFWTKKNGGREGARHADERVKSHGEREAERLSNDLIALRYGVT